MTESFPKAYLSADETGISYGAQQKPVIAEINFLLRSRLRILVLLNQNAVSAHVENDRRAVRIIVRNRQQLKISSVGNGAARNTGIFYVFNNRHR
ncbi:MAG: hypothetical protein ACE37N_12395 [Pseudohongiellaceae bacterium]